MIVAQRMASVTGLRVPATKGAAVKGISPTDISLRYQDQLLGSRILMSIQNTSQRPNDSSRA